MTLPSFACGTGVYPWDCKARPLPLHPEQETAWEEPRLAQAAAHIPFLQWMAMESI